MNEQTPDWHLDTLAIRTGHARTAEGEHSEPIFATSSFVFGTAAEAAARFSGDDPGNIYSRFTNPTVRAFEERLAAMEGGECCVATASGMAAIWATVTALLQHGDHLVSAREVFGSTRVLFEKYLQRFGIAVSWAKLTDLDSWEKAIRPNTRMLFMESPSNPLTEIGDIRALADLAHANDALLVVDNCFCTPALQRPLAFGADIVVHSATKYLDGQGRCIGGAVVGDAKLVGEEVFGVLRTAGPTMSPFNAWVFLKGLETLRVRMNAHCLAADGLAAWLAQQPEVVRAFYPGHSSHPQQSLALTQQDKGGGIVAFEVSGGRDQAWRVINRVKLFSITANLGDVKSTITHPATTTHARLSESERLESGITDGLVRISAGLEHLDDLVQDLAQALR